MGKGRLPSDQDSSGRNFGEEELGFLREVLESGTLTATKGRMVKTLAEQFARVVGVASRERLLVWNCSHPCRNRRARPRAGRRDHHHPHHRHGSAGADPVPGRHPRLRRRGSAHRQRHGRHDCRHGSAIARRPSWSRTCSAIPARCARSWRSPTGTGCRLSRTARRRISPRRRAGRSARSARSAASACSRESTSRLARAGWS